MGLKAVRHRKILVAVQPQAFAKQASRRQPIFV
jgi:hypothetical protein